jgi:hypothetical protein
VNFLLNIPPQYLLVNTMVGNLRIARSVSTVKCSQSVPSTQTLEFKTILDQRVQAQMTHLATDYERPSARMTELRRLVMKMRSQMGDTCALFYSPHGPGKDSAPPPPAPLF